VIRDGEELRLWVSKDLVKRIRQRAAQLGVYPADYANGLLAKAVDKDLRVDITAVDLLPERKG